MKTFPLLVLASLPLTFAAGETKPTSPPATATVKQLSFFDGRVVFDIEERVRFEARENNRDFDATANDPIDDSWLLSRFRLGLAIVPTPWLKFYAQGQDSREWLSGRGRIPGVNGAEGYDQFDLRQGYIELADYTHFPLGLTIGRQVIDYGDRRLIGDSKWSNFGRTFDGARLRFQQPKWWIEGFFARPVQIKTFVFDDHDAQDDISGVYLSNRSLPFQTTDLYYFYRDKSGVQPSLSPTNTTDPRGSWSGPAGRYSTIGARIDSQPGKLRGWDYNAEIAYQFGDTWTGARSGPRLSQRAFAAHAASGFTFEKTPWKPRVGLEYNYASGDRDPFDGESQSFQNLFPSNHEKYGFMDEFAWRNMHDARLQLNLNPTKTLALSLDYHAFWLANTSDYWFRSNGFSPLRTRTPDGRDVRLIDASQFAGQEIDFVMKWDATAWLKLEAGYSHFFAGTYLSDTGRHDGADFGYVMATVKF